MDLTGWCTSENGGKPAILITLPILKAIVVLKLQWFLNLFIRTQWREPPVYSWQVVTNACGGIVGDLTFWFTCNIFCQHYVTCNSFFSSSYGHTRATSTSQNMLTVNTGQHCSCMPLCLPNHQWYHGLNKTSFWFFDNN